MLGVLGMQVAALELLEAEGQGLAWEQEGPGWMSCFSGLRAAGRWELAGQVLRPLGLHSFWGKPEPASMGPLSPAEEQRVITAKPLCQRPGGFGSAVCAQRVR